jgi:hypothetical protein
MNNLTKDIDEYHNNKRALAHLYLLTMASKAIATIDARKAAEEGSSISQPTGSPLIGLYQASGARVIKRSRKGKARHISLHIMVDDKGTFLYWYSMLGLRKKKFNLSTLFEMGDIMVEYPKSSHGITTEMNVLRLRNDERSLDLVAESPGDHAVFSKFFNGFRT